MSQKAGGAGVSISLPKGGGALHGIGETFSPDLQTGTGNFTVPVALPPGRNGFQPQLSLVYSTGNGNGPFGLGWGLSVPGVSRKTSKGIPVYDDAKDTFVLSGAEDLVPVSGEPSEATRYRPRTEGLFARIEHHHEPGNDYWMVRSKDGLVSFYGTPGPAGVNNVWRDPAVIADPDNPEHIFAWKLTRTVDPFGNRIDYAYGRDAVQTDGPHHWDQLRLSEIRYVDHGDTANPQFLVTVRFTYDERPDPFSDYRAGFEVRTVRRCATIEIFTHEQPNTLARSYRFTYLDQRDLRAEQRPLNGVSMLSQVKVVGHDGEETEELPALEFGYSRFEPEKRQFFPITGSDMPPVSLAHQDYELVDLFGNGLPDVLEMNGTVRFWRNLGGSRFDLPREMRSAPVGLRLADQGVQLADADGDGRTDLLVTTVTMAGYFPLRFGGLWDRHSFQRYQRAPSFNLEDPDVRLVDLDGDGVTDAIRSGARLECFFNNPKEGWKGTRRVERMALDQFENINFSDPRVKWADLSGDGLQDIVLVYDGSIEYWPNLGYGNWGKRIHMRHSPRFPYGYDPKRILIGDVDGDGLADLVYVDDTKVKLWINQSGNGWSEPIVIKGTPSVTDMDSVRLADMLGNGVSGILWSANAGQLSRQSMFFLDFTGGIKPYLLNEMDNHIGAVTRVAYAPSTRFYLEDQKQPATRWKTPLPFPVQVVAHVEAIDDISGGKLTTEYRYHHGYWDGAEREFRGFGRVDHRDTEAFENFNSGGLHPKRPSASIERKAFSPPTETRTWFHQGPIGDEFGEWEETDFSNEYWPGDLQVLFRPPSMTDLLKGLPRRVKRDALRTLRGSILRSELYALDGTDRADSPYTVTESLHGVCEVIENKGATILVCAAELLPSSARDDEGSMRIFFPHALAQRTTQWERGDDPMTQFSFSDDYDDYGQSRLQAVVAVPRWRKHNFAEVAASSIPTDDPVQPKNYLATLTRTEYAQRDDTMGYMVNRVARSTMYEILNDGSMALLALKQAVFSDPGNEATQQLIGQSVNFYDGDAFQGLPLFSIGAYGALVRTETLVLTEKILHDAYTSGATVTTPAEEPPYLAPSGAPPWTSEYPPEFRSQMPALAGYIFRPGGPDLIAARGYFVVTDQRRYDFHNATGQGRGLVVIKRDAVGHDTSVQYDLYKLLPIELTDPVSLTTKAIYDYRVLQPSEVTDANSNQTVVTFTPLGFLKSTSVKGKAGEGDQKRPSVKMEYNFLAFENSAVDLREPIFVRTVRQEHHDTEADVLLPERDATIESVEYSDGFGRLLQTHL